MAPKKTVHQSSEVRPYPLDPKEGHHMLARSKYLRNLPSGGMELLFRKNLGFPIFIALLFFGALFWATARDPFKRYWFSIKTENGLKTRAVAVLPKPAQQRPVVFFFHGKDETLLNSGLELRQISEMGLAAIRVQYDQSNVESFSAQVEALYAYIREQEWADTNAIAWIGNDLGADRALALALKRPDLQPQLMVQLRGTWIDSLNLLTNASTKPLLKSRILFIHSENDAVAPPDHGTRLVNFFQANALSAELMIVPKQVGNFEPDRTLLFRVLGELCLKTLVGPNGLRDYRSIGLWKERGLSFAVFTMPAMVWGAVLLYARTRSRVEQRFTSPLAWWEKAIRYLALFCVLITLGQLTIHFVMPRLNVNAWRLAVAQRFLVPSRLQEDFHAVKDQPYWGSQKLSTLLEHLELSSYNRGLVNWRVDDETYRQYVLSPVIVEGNEDLKWRRPLWESFYPRIRKEHSVFSAAKTIVRHLRERVTISNQHPEPLSVPDIWLHQMVNEAGFEKIYVAAMRSVGIAARLTPDSHAELWDGTSWQLAPRPTISHLDSLLPLN